MTIKDIQLKLYNAQKDKDESLVGVLRFVLSLLKNKEIELRALHEDLTSDDIAAVIKKQIKQQKKAIEMFKAGGRQDLVDKDEIEIKIMQGLLDEFGLSD